MKKIFTSLLTVLLASVLVLSTACGYPAGTPPFYNPDDTPGNGPSDSGRYTITLMSEGGLPLNNIQVTASKNGEVIKSGISSNGKVTLAMDLDNYTLSFNNIPKGYYLDENKEYVTSNESNEYTVLFKSKVISQTAPVGTVYKVGDVIYDFVFNYYNGDTDTTTQHRLSDILATKKAVMLNFWYKDCPPCRAEFPVMQEAYEIYSQKIEILAFNNTDGKATIYNFKKDNALDFYMFQDTSNITGLFNVQAFPTTVIIDRYGVIAVIESGTITNVNEWKSLFAKYTADDYVQTPPAEDEEEDDDGAPVRVKPTFSMPESDAIAKVMSGEGVPANAVYTGEIFTDDKEYSWPWLVTTETSTGLKYLSASNSNVQYSFATLYANFSVEMGDMISFDYNIDTEPSSDILYVMLNGNVVAQFDGNSNGWKTAQLYVFNKNSDVKLTFLYNKNNDHPNTDVSGYTDNVFIKNITVANVFEDETEVKTIDIQRDCATGEVTANGYSEYVDVMLADDGYYHVKEYDLESQTYYPGAIVVTSLVTPTPWTTFRYSANTIEYDTAANTEYYRTPYYISFYKFGQEPSDQNFVYLGTNYNKVMHDAYFAEGWSASFDCGYIAVNEHVKNMLDAFAKDFATNYYPSTDKLNVYTENTWLEFCYYYDHFGEDHTSDTCYVDTIPSLGVRFLHPFEISPSAKQVTDGITYTANNRYPLAEHRGVKYSFTAPKTGVYRITSLSENSTIDPEIFVMSGRFTDEFVYQDVTLAYDRFEKRLDGNDKYLDNFCKYLYLEEDEVAYFSCAIGVSLTGEYNFEIKWMGEEIKVLELATTGEGAWTYDPENPSVIYYPAVKCAYDDLSGYYRTVNSNGEFESTVYIDLLRGNFFDQNGHSIMEMVDEGYFDFSENGGGDFTQTMRTYLANATEGLTEEDELYGMAIADKNLVDILNYIILTHMGDGPETNAWRMFASYYHYYGANPHNAWN